MVKEQVLPLVLVEFVCVLSGRFELPVQLRVALNS